MQNHLASVDGYSTMVLMVLTTIITKLVHLSEPSTKYILPLFLLCYFMPARAATYYVATTGNDGNPCSQNLKCQTFSRAYQAAQPGDTVLVSAGNYSQQTMSRGNASMTGNYSLTPHSGDVTFKPESGPGTVTLAELTVGTQDSNGDIIQHVVFQDMTITSGGDIGNGRCIHYVGTTHRSTIIVNRAAYISYQHVDIGAHNNTDGITFAQYNYSYWPNNLLIEDSIIHDIHAEAIDAHPDSISFNFYEEHAINFTLRRTKFYNNDCINFRADVGTGYLIENNFFGAVTSWGCGYTAQLHGRGALVRFNTFEGDIQNAGAAEAPNQRWVGNILLAGSGCPNGNNSGVVSEYNVWNTNRPVSCGGAANIPIADFSTYFVSKTPTGPTGSNLQLTVNATGAINAVPLSVSYPTTDFYGKSRPVGSATDAGAHEFGSSTSSTVNPPTNLTVAVR
jgi:hypothetical protein